MICRFFCAVAMAALFWPAMADAEISQPSEIPSYLSGNDDLALRRSALMTQWEGLQKKITEQNAQCGQIAEDSPMVEFCRSNQAVILSEIKNYKETLRQYEDALAKTQNPTPYDNLLLMRERNLRDLEKAKQARGKAMLQKSRLQAALEHAKKGTRDPSLSKEAFDIIVAGAPAGIQRAEQTLTETAHSIKELEMKLKWTERAIKNLDSAMKPERGYDPKYEVGFGMVLQPGLANVQVLRAGHDSAIPLGDGSFLPGDEIITDPWGQTKVSSLGSSNYVVAVGPETRLKLEQDHKIEGTVWSLNKGIVHYSPLTQDGNANPARLRTPDSIVQGSPDSEFDVRISDKGETFVEVYRGRVEVQEPMKGASYFIDSKTDGARTVKPWWNADQ
jgi:tetratricopeptide (TPR) repeat protein